MQANLDNDYIDYLLQLPETSFSQEILENNIDDGGLFFANLLKSSIESPSATRRERQRGLNNALADRICTYIDSKRFSSEALSIINGIAENHFKSLSSILPNSHPYWEAMEALALTASLQAAQVKARDSSKDPKQSDTPSAGSGSGSTQPPQNTEKNEKREHLHHFLETVHSQNPQALPPMIGHLSECRRKDCMTPHARGENIDAKILSYADKIPKDQTVHYVSVGAGGLLQDWAIIAKMIQKGFKKFSLHFIDEAYTEAAYNEGAFYQPFESYKWREMKPEFEESLKILGASEVQVTLYAGIDRYRKAHSGRPIDILMAVDVPRCFLEKVRCLEADLLQDGGSSSSSVPQERSHPFAFYALGGKSPEYYFYPKEALAKRKEERPFLYR